MFDFVLLSYTTMAETVSMLQATGLMSKITVLGAGSVCCRLHLAFGGMWRWISVVGGASSAHLAMRVALFVILPCGNISDGVKYLRRT